MSLKVLKSITALLLSVLLFFGTTYLPMFEAYAVDEQVIIGEQNTDSNDEVELSKYYLNVSNGSSNVYLQSDKRKLCIKIYKEDENETKDIGFLVQDSSNKLNYYFDRETVETIQSLETSATIRYKVIDFEFRGEGTIETDAFSNDEVGEFTVTTQYVEYEGYFEAYNQKTYDGKEHTAVNILSTKEGYANAFEDVTVEYAVTQDEGNSDNLSYQTDIPKITDAGNYTVYVKLTKGYSSTTITLNAGILKNKEYAEFTKSEINAVLSNRVGNPVKSLDDNLISSDKLTVNYDISTDYAAYATVDRFGNLTLRKTTDDLINGIPVTATVSVIGNSNFEKLELKYFLKINKSMIKKDSLSWYVNGAKVDTDAIVADYSSDLEYKCELKLNEESFHKGDVTYSIETDDVPSLEVDSDTDIFTVKVNSAGSFKLESKLNEDKYYCDEIPSLSFTINKIDRSETIGFKEKSNLASNDFKVGFGTDLDVSLENVSSDVEYNVSVIEGEDFASIEKDSDTGIWTLKPKEIGNVKIMATVPGNGIYNEKIIDMDIEIVKGDHELKVTYSDQVVTDNYEIDCNIGQADKGMIFSLASDDAETDYDVIVSENSIIKDNQVENGKLTISFNEKVTGTAKVTVKKEETGHYNAASITFTISLDFGVLTSIEEPCYTVEGVKKDENNGWYTGKVNIKPKNQDFMINLSSFSSSDFDEKFTSNWEICTDGEYSFCELYYKDKDGNIYKEKNVSQDLPLNGKLDSTAPTIESVTIEDINIEEESYFSNSDTNTLKITVQDETSGVASVLYKLSKDGEYTQVDAKQLTQNVDGSVTAIVKLTCEIEKTIINGSLYVKVMDNAGLEINNEQKETKVVVIDRKAPTLKNSSQSISNDLQKLSCDIVFEDDSPFESDNQKYVQEVYLKTQDGSVVNVVPTITTNKDGELCISFEIDKPGVYIPIITLQDNCKNMTEWNAENSPLKFELLDKPKTPQFKLSNASTDTDTFNKEESLSSAVLSFTAQHVNYDNFDIQCSVKDYEDSDIDADKTLENAIRDFLRNYNNWHKIENCYSIDIASCLKNINGKVELTIMYKNNIYSNGGGEDLFSVKKSFTIDTIAPTDLSYKVENGLINTIMMTITPFKIITKENFTVILSAKDNLNGGIDRFEYTTDGTTYNKAINEDGSWIVRFRGNINANFKFRVYDKANNVSYYDEFDNIVVDKIHPIITINGNNSEINSDNAVFEDNAKITIHIKEDHPSGDEPTVKLERIVSPLNKDYYRECSYELVEEGDCVYSITIVDLAKYRLTVNYKDAAGNEAETKIAEFIVISSSDKTESGDNLFDIVLSNDNLCKDTQYDGILYNKDVSASIVINDNHYFMPELLEVECTISNASGDVSDYNELTNTVNNSENWSIKNNKWSLQDGLIHFSDSAVYEIKVKYNGKEKCSKKFTIDGVDPVLKDIKFSEGTHESIDGKSYVFYGAKEYPEVSFCVEDLTSGIKTIECTFDDKYDSKEIKTIPLNNTNNGSGQYTVAIPENYTGQVLITVYDYAGNIVNNVNSDGKIVDSEGRIMPELVTDSIVPNLKVSFGKENQEFNEYNGVKYFRSAVEMKATLVEKNFFQDSFSFIISKENGDKWEKYNLDSTLTATTDKTDTFSGCWEFSDSGKYSYKVYYVDKSGNESEIYEGIFVVDTTPPKLTITYKDISEDTDTEDTDTKDGLFSNESQTAIITITDANLPDLSKDAISINAALTYYNNSDSDSTQYVTTDCDLNIDSVTNKDYATDIGSVTFSESKDQPNTYVGIYHIPMVYNDKTYKNCDVTLSTTVCDKANNSASETRSKIIDMEAPTVTIQYENEQCGNEPACKEGKNNHNHDVTATIQIVDANLDVELGESQDKYLLSESVFRVDVSAFDNSGARYTGISGLKFQESSDESELSLGNNNIQMQLVHQESSHVYEAKVTFSCDVKDVYVNYALNISVSDLAGNSANSFTKGDNTFTIDKESPNIEEINIVGGETEGENKGKKYYNTDQTLKIKIQEAFLDTDRCTLEIVKTDNEGIETTDTATPNITQEGDLYFVEKKFSQDADYKVTLKTTDYSGNTACLTRSFTIDKTPPDVKITFDNNSVQNSKYFKDKRKATITVTEHNFDTNNNILKITAQDNNENPVGNYNSMTKILEWSNDGDEYKAYVEFSDDANYLFAFTCKDQAGNNNSQIDFDESAGEFKIVNGQKQVVFTVDTKSPEGSVKVGDWLTDSSLRNEYSYNQFSNESQTVTLKAHDDLSGAILVEYITSSEIYNLSQLKTKSNWKKCDNNSNYSFEMTPNSRFIVYMHIVDNAGNEKFVSSNGVILDNMEPKVETLAPTISISPSISSNNGIFNTDVPFSVTVVDSYNNDVYSGLNNVSYEIINMGNVTESGVLYSTTTPMIQKYENDSAIVVNSSENNSNDITVRISATDFAGNMSSRDYNFAIDVTAPYIKLSYDNNNAQNSKYFKAPRIATIEVTERNFVPDDFDLKLENAYGTIPSIESWTKVSEGTGNGDDAVWSATLEFSNDGDYSVGMSVTDEAGNGNSEFDYEGTSPLEFVIDRTAPKLTVVYDNNDASEGNYFADYRVATLTINERNFSSNDVNTHISAKLKGADITAPGVSGWSDQGNVHTAEVKYNQDGDYQFNINYTDLAGNTIEEYAADEFHIDKTKAKITIKGVEDKTSYRGKVEPVITVTDNNFSSKNTTITLTGASRGRIKDISALTTERKIDNGVEISFMNFEEKKEIDDIYTLIVSHRDLAGNETMSKLVFSVNRFGSTYEFSDATSRLNKKYVNKNKVNDIIISEVNVTELTSHTVTIYKDGVAIVLQQGRDYNIERISGEKWYKYVYTIFASNFTEDGIYSIKISSVDSAGNVADNTLDTKVKNLTFAVDNTPPELFVTNVISGETYPVASLNAIISATDNIQVASLELYLDGEKVQGWNEEQIRESLLNSENLSYEIPGNSTSPHNMKLICYDKADNCTEIELEKFYVTTNILIRLLTNKLLVFCILTIIAAMLLLTTVVVLIKRKRR